MKKAFAAFLVASAICLAQPAPDPRIGTILEELASVHTFDQVALSPDGKRAAWIEDAAIYVLEVGGKKGPARITPAKGGSTRDLAWSPDGKMLAFLSDRDKKGQMQLYVNAEA